MTFRLRHLLAALALHAVLFAVLLGGLQCARKPVKPPVIRAVLLDPDRKEVAQQRQREEQRRQDERRRAEQERQRQQEENRRRAEEEKRRQEALALEKRKQEEEARRQKELAEQKKAEEEARRKKQQEERERQEQAQRELQEKARMEEQIRQEAMRRELEQEQQAREASERATQEAEWAEALRQHIAKNWLRPPNTADFECQVRVQLLPDGSVTFARIVRSCGNSALDKSVEDAVFRSSPLPRPRDPAVFQRDLVINFRP